MRHTHYLIWFTLSLVMAQVDDLPYCSPRYERLCLGKGQHVACKFPYRGRGYGCENYTAIIFSEDLKSFILHYVNRRRQRIASGHERVRGGIHLPKPKVMMMVQWDRELAYLAQRLADQCEFLHDDCRATVRYPYAGQTVGEVRWRRVGESLEMGAKRTIRRVFDAWWGEKRRVQARQLTSPFVLTARGAVWGHFSQLAVWTLRAMGCGAVHHGFSKPRLLLVCDFSHTNMLGQRTISPGPLAPCPMHTMRIPTSLYPQLCSPGRLAEVEDRRDIGRDYRDDEDEPEFEETHEGSDETMARWRPIRPYEANEELGRPRPNKPIKSDEIVTRSRPDRLDDSKDVTRPWQKRPDESHEATQPWPDRPDEFDEEITKPRPNRLDETNEEVITTRSNRPDESDEEVIRSSHRPDKSGDVYERRPWLGGPIKPAIDDSMDLEEVQSLRTSSRTATRRRTKTYEMITAGSVRYREEQDGVFKQKLNSELSLKRKEELRDREEQMRHKAAYKSNNGRGWDMRSKSEHKVLNDGWETSQSSTELGQWRDYHFTDQNVIPLRKQNDIADWQELTTIVVYRPTYLSMEPLIRHRWKKPRNRPRRPGASALLHTPPATLLRRQPKASLVLLDKEDEDQLFLDTGFKISSREPT